MGALEELASYADVEGLDWQRINADGEGIVGSGGYLSELQERWQRFYDVTETLAITDAQWEETTAEQAADAWQEVRRHVSDKADQMLTALGRGELRVAWDHAATVYSGSLKKLIIATSAVSHRNLTAHEDGTMSYAVQTGQTTLEAAEKDADHIAMLWSAVVQLDQWGAFGGLKKKQFAGVGAAPGAAAGTAARGLPIVIAAVGIAAVIAAVIVFLAYLSHRNGLIEDYCFDAEGQLRADAPHWCDQAGEQLTSDPLAVFLEPVRQTGKALATGLAVAAGVGVVLWVAPSAIRRLTEAR